MRRTALAIVMCCVALTAIAFAQSPAGFAGRWAVTLETKPAEPIALSIGGATDAVTGTFGQTAFTGAIAGDVLNVTLSKATDTSAYTTIKATRLPSGDLTGTLVYNFEYAPGQWMGKSTRFVAKPVR